MSNEETEEFNRTFICNVDPDDGLLVTQSHTGARLCFSPRGDDWSEVFLGPARVRSLRDMLSRWLDHQDGGRLSGLSAEEPAEGPYDHLQGQGPALLYRHSDGTAFTFIDQRPVHYPDDADADTTRREQLLCKALIQHAYALMDGRGHA